MSVTFSPSDTEIISASKDKTIQLWSADNGKHLKTFICHSDQILSVAVSHNGIQMVSASSDQTVKVWDILADNNQGALDKKVTFLAFLYLQMVLVLCQCCQITL